MKKKVQRESSVWSWRQEVRGWSRKWQFGCHRALYNLHLILQPGFACWTLPRICACAHMCVCVCVCHLAPSVCIYNIYNMCLSNFETNPSPLLGCLIFFTCSSPHLIASLISFFFHICLYHSRLGPSHFDMTPCGIYAIIEFFTAKDKLISYLS